MSKSNSIEFLESLAASLDAMAAKAWAARDAEAKRAAGARADIAEALASRARVMEVWAAETRAKAKAEAAKPDNK